VDRYLAVTGFRKVVEEQLTIDAPEWDQEHHVALTRIDREDQQAADEVARRLAELFARHMRLDPGHRAALTTMFAELVENVYRHAQSNFGTYLMAQAYPKPRKLHVVVADTGIGIYDSFRKSDSSEIRERASSEAVALEMALQKLVTSKTDRHSGYGLYIVRRLVEQNGGAMRLTSGRASKRIALERPRWARARTVAETIDHLPWGGTEISLMFDLDRPLPLMEIYRELGPPTRAEDFFD
jgi:anti-sigma regulatory factor (Ser/Thr protein kinase)